MNLRLLLPVILPLLPLSAADFSSDEPRDIPGWKLVWHDEFDAPALDTNKWTAETRDLAKNHEKQHYAEDEVYIENGCLVLRSQKRSLGRYDYTSGLVDSRGKFSQAYGRFEIRARLPKGKGMWPAHWLLPVDKTWPPELDIMEMLGHDTQRVLMTQHWRDNDHKAVHRGYTYRGADYSKDFHTFTLEWTENSLRWFIDGKQRYISKWNIPDHPFFIILNSAVGGDLPGDPDDTTVFPQYHLIDYVRVYERTTY